MVSAVSDCVPRSRNEDVSKNEVQEEKTVIGEHENSRNMGARNVTTKREPDELVEHVRKLTKTVVSFVNTQISLVKKESFVTVVNE